MVFAIVAHPKSRAKLSGAWESVCDATTALGPGFLSAVSEIRDVEELIMAIVHYIDKHNDNPKPFVWTAKASDILEKVKRARHALDNR